MHAVLHVLSLSCVLQITSTGALSLAKHMMPRYLLALLFSAPACCRANSLRCGFFWQVRQQCIEHLMSSHPDYFIACISTGQQAQRMQTKPFVFNSVQAA